MSAFHDNALLGASGQQGYTISRSVRLRSSASAYFGKAYTAGSSPADTNNKIKTYSFWAKRGALGSTAEIISNYTTSGNFWGLFFDTNNCLNVYDVAGSSTTCNLVTTQVFRDPSAWYHFVVAVDTTQATASNRVKVYVNGNQITSFSTATYMSQNAVSASFFTPAGGTWNAAIGALSSVGNYFDSYITEFNVIDGQALTPSSFGQSAPITGVWTPKKYAGTYGTNGFYLNFSDNSSNTATTIGKDNSGNGNNWTPNNISVTSGVTYDSMIDVPTPYADGGNGRGNYCTLNPLKNTASISNANLQTVNAASGGYYTSYATMAMDTGKYYWEITVVDDNLNSRYLGIGVADPSIALTGSTTSVSTGTQAGNARGWTQTVRSAVSVAGTGLYNNSSTVNSTTRSTTSGTRVFMVAYDADTGKCWMGYEGTWWSGDPAAGTSQYFTAAAPMVPVLNPYNDGSIGSFVASVNFGQRPFAYTPPSGFKALNTFNLPDSTIKKGNQYFDINLWTGTGASRSITNSGAMQPDLVWTKDRGVGTSSHGLFDSVRGNTKVLSSNSTNAESTVTDEVTSFNSDGFSLGASSNGYANYNGRSFVGWQWKESATAGFDIVTQTATASGNQTINHSLGVTPSFVIIKSRAGGVANWPVWIQGIGTDHLNLNTTGGRNASGYMVSQSSTTFVFNVALVNASNTYVAYLFSEVAGFSKFGSYTGNGSADGPFVYCGFRPRWVMVKRTDSAGYSWYVYDTARDTFNQMTSPLYPNLSNAESVTTIYIDTLSNGFKLRTTSADTNASGGTYIFVAFAENPFKYSLAR